MTGSPLFPQSGSGVPSEDVSIIPLLPRLRMHPSTSKFLFGWRLFPDPGAQSDSIVLRVGKTPVQLVGKGYGTVFSAGAADADNELMLALGNIIRNQKTDHIL